VIFEEHFALFHQANHFNGPDATMIAWILIVSAVTPVLSPADAAGAKANIDIANSSALENFRILDFPCRILTYGCNIIMKLNNHCRSPTLPLFRICGPRRVWLQVLDSALSSTEDDYTPNYKEAIVLSKFPLHE
jgi:hypothetical protein